MGADSGNGELRVSAHATARAYWTSPIPVTLVTGQAPPLEVAVPRILVDVIGSVLIAVTAVNAGMQFARLRRRHHAVSQVVSAPAGRPVRLALLAAALGVWLLIGGWAIVGVMWAIIAWELIVDMTALVGRRRRRASHAS